MTVSETLLAPQLTALRCAFLLAHHHGVHLPPEGLPAIDQSDMSAPLRRALEQALASGKPESVVEKMVEGRIRKFYEEVVLLKQAFVMNPDQTVEQLVEATGKELGSSLKVQGFVRLALGEGVEKEVTDFAAEVASMTGGA